MKRLQLVLTLAALLVSVVAPASAADAPDAAKPTKAERRKAAAAAQAERAARRQVASDAKQLDARTFTSADGVELPYRWLAPQSVEAGTKYPLVLCLHGVGRNSVAPGILAADELREKYPCFILYPDAGEGGSWLNTATLGRLGTRKEKLPAVVELIRTLLKSEPIDPARIYVTGQSMGGVGSWAAAATYPDLFAAAVPVCGAWDVADAPKMTPVAIWAFHGENDGTVPVKYSRELTAAVNEAGGKAKYTEYRGVGHGSWGPAYAEAELWPWLFAQKKAE